jgi:hypothetical protein
MKKTVLVLLMSVCFYTNAQETEFKFTKEGFTDYVVIPIEGKTAQELYKKTLDWVSLTYKNPKEVIKAQIENDYIRIQGIKSNMLCVKSLGISTCFDVRYEIEISLKDGKYKFDVTRIEQYSPPSQYSSGGWVEFQLTNFAPYFKESGEVRQMFKQYPEAFQSTFNDLNKDLETLLKSNTIPSKKGDW